MNIGTKIKGKYLGEIEITGTVVKSRPITVRTDGCVEHTIALDQPVSVYGIVRTRVNMNTLLNGEPSGYTRFTDHMEEIA